MLTQEQLKEILNYDPETGVFTWMIPRARKMKVGDKAGTINNKGYVMIYYKMKCYQAHRLAWLYITGEHPDQIDHINGERNNNKFNNLRNVCSVENSRNCKLHKRNTSGANGVAKLNTGVFISRISVMGKLITKTHYSFEDAVKNRKDMDRLYGFHPNHGTIRPTYAQPTPAKHEAEK